jgi:hypothetical protein
MMTIPVEKEAGVWERDGVTVISKLKAPLLIHVNMHIIRENAKGGQASISPPITIRRGRSSKVLHRCMEVELSGPSKVIYNNEIPLGCGARMWIETDGSLTCR